MPVFNHLSLPSADAFAMMADMAAKGGPSRLKRKTGEPSREALSIPVGGGLNPADLYLPAEEPRAGLLLVPGVARGGKDDPRLINFAHTLARLGFAVLVPHLESLKDLSVRPWHAQIVAESFLALHANPQWAPEGRAGIGGLSFAMGPGVLAAVTPGIAEYVRFVFCIGGYFDLWAQARFVTTGMYREYLGQGAYGSWQHMPPDHYGRWVLAASLAPHIQEPASRAAVQGMIDRRQPDAEAPIDDLQAQVQDPDAQALLNLIHNTDAARFDALVEALPKAMANDLHELNVARRDLSTLRARLILVHGYEDNLIPYVQSQALHRSAPAGQSHLYLVRGLRHVTMERPGPLSIWRLLNSVSALLAERR